MMRAVLWSASTQLPISFKGKWNTRTSITSPACSPIWTRSPTANGRRQTMKSHPARLRKMSLRAIAMAAGKPDLDDQQEADRRGDVGGGLLPAVPQAGVVGAAPENAQHHATDRPDGHHHDQAVE